VRAVVQAAARELWPTNIHVARLIIDSGVGTAWVPERINAQGMIGRLIEARRHAINVAAQYYETRNDVGYVVLDADASGADSQRVLGEIRPRRDYLGEAPLQASALGRHTGDAPPRQCINRRLTLDSRRLWQASLP
jgi:hypothetical protein